MELVDGDCVGSVVSIVWQSVTAVLSFVRLVARNSAVCGFELKSYLHDGISWI